MALDFQAIIVALRNHPDDQTLSKRISAEHPEVVALLLDFVARQERLSSLAAEMLRVVAALVRCYDRDGTFFVCGNGGSFADSLHMAGELLKSFEKDRSLTDRQKELFIGLEDGAVLAEHLEQGLRAYALGNSGPLATAVQNDNKLRDIHFAQDLYAMARPGDVVMGISTSGNAKNVYYALQVGKALGLTTISLTGERGGKAAGIADIALKAPGTVTKYVQEAHFPIYHAICAMIEAYYFPRPR